MAEGAMRVGRRAGWRSVGLAVLALVGNAEAAASRFRAMPRRSPPGPPTGTPPESPS